MTPASPDPAARLEAALERIARAAQAGAEAAAAPSPPASPDPALVARLDSLILQLREALDE